MNKKPNITLSLQDLDRIEALLDSLPPNASADTSALLGKLEHAEVVEPQEMPPSVVTMNSTVRFALKESQKEFCLTLAYPKDTNGNPDRISVLAPVGSALLGLSTGDHIEWPRPGGGIVKVEIMEVVYQPERAGEYHR